jgi:hypothetical protein
MVKCAKHEAGHGERVCPRTGKLVGKKTNRWWIKCFFPFLGFTSLLWFLVRVIPKPSRAAYPCQRVAAPIASSFVVWLLGVGGAAIAFRNARAFLYRSRHVLAIVCILAGLSTSVYVMVKVPDSPADLWTPTDSPNTPVGTARGIHPGRVAWVYDPTATSWDGTNGYWWQNSNTDIGIVSNILHQVWHGPHPFAYLSAALQATC